MASILTVEEVRNWEAINRLTDTGLDIEDINRLCQSHIALWKERDQWKAQHDYQVEMKRKLSKRYGELMKERMKALK